VGHSHGGNIALKAGRSSAGAGHVAGIVTLATPFLEFNENPPGVAWLAAVLRHGVRPALKVAAAWVGLGLLALVMSPLSILMLRAKEGLRGGPREPTIFDLVVAPGIAFIYAIAMFAIAFDSGRRAAGRIDAPRVIRLRRQLARYFYVQPAQELEGVPVLSMTAPLDEALQALNGAWWTHRVVIWTARLLVGAALLILVAAAAFSAVALGFVSTKVAYQPEFFRSALLYFFAIGVVVVPSAFILAAALASLLRAIASLPAPMLGLRGGTRRLLWSVHARRRLDLGPMSFHRDYTLSDLLGTGFGLMHSRLYKSPRAVRDVAAWMSSV
jgi:hypothetical protein